MLNQRPKSACASDNAPSETHQWVESASDNRGLVWRQQRQRLYGPVQLEWYTMQDWLRMDRIVRPTSSVRVLGSWRVMAHPYNPRQG